MDRAPDLAWGTTSRRELHELAERHGTPYFLYDADVVCRRIEAVRAAFDGVVQVYFAVKANPNRGLLRAVRRVADGLDISSVGELEQACLAGFDPGQLRAPRRLGSRLSAESAASASSLPGSCAPASRRRVRSAGAPMSCCG
jgi:hypothetical protein